MAHQTIHAEQVITAPAGLRVQQSIRALLAPSTTRRVPAQTVLARTVPLALPAPMALRIARFATLENMSMMRSVNLARRGTGAKMDTTDGVQ